MSPLWGGWLWFDVEKKYKTITMSMISDPSRLWFDVEKKYKTIMLKLSVIGNLLWFDVEMKYKTIGCIA